MPKIALPTMLTRRNRKPWALPPRPGETEAALSERRNRAYFDSQVVDSEHWWLRMGAPDDLYGKRVLDFGCGHGALTLQVARQGCAWVTGLDLEEDYIAFAERNLRERFPELGDRVEFLCRDIAEIPGTAVYDCVVCKDTFEHVQNLAVVVSHMHRLLKPGGLLHVGFSPLFHSPFGDHGRLWYPLPWLSALLPEGLLFKLATKRTGKTIRHIGDVGLNKLTPAEFRNLFQGDEWKISSVRYNVGEKKLLRPMSFLRTVPALEKYFTVSIYASMIRL